MKIKYDFHIHSCLSPCAEPEMTPYNIVAMAGILELDVIAVTDHNSLGNSAAAIEAGRQAGMLVIPGMELTTSEEIHMVCLFSDIKNAEAFGRMVYSTIPEFKNKPEIFGDQFYMDSADNIIGVEDKLLINASGISFEDAPAICREYGGICYPAHIDRSSHSVLSSFGMIDPSMDFAHVEIANAEKTQSLITAHPLLSEKTIIYSSDSHRLETFAVMEHATIDLDRVSPNAVIEWFSKNSGR